MSKAEVESSKIKIEEFLIKALEIDILCFCPPESPIPLSPISVLNPSSKVSMKSKEHANLEYFFTSSISAFSLLNFILFNIESENKKVSC